MKRFHTILTQQLDADGQPHVLKEPKYPPLDRMVHERGYAPHTVINTEIPASLTEIKSISQNLKPTVLVTVLSCSVIIIASSTDTASFSATWSPSYAQVILHKTLLYNGLQFLLQDHSICNAKVQLFHLMYILHKQSVTTAFPLLDTTVENGQTDRHVYSQKSL